MKALKCDRQNSLGNTKKWHRSLNNFCFFSSLIIMLILKHMRYATETLLIHVRSWFMCFFLITQKTKTKADISVIAPSHTEFSTDCILLLLCSSYSYHIRILTVNWDRSLSSNNFNNMEEKVKHTLSWSAARRHWENALDTHQLF